MEQTAADKAALKHLQPNAEAKRQASEKVERAEQTLIAVVKEQFEGDALASAIDDIRSAVARVQQHIQEK